MPAASLCRPCCHAGRRTSRDLPEAGGGPQIQRSGRSGRPVRHLAPTGCGLHNKASLLADKFAITSEAPASRNGAWSAAPHKCEHLIPASRVFSRITSDAAPSVAEVERALLSLYV